MTPPRPHARTFLHALTVRALFVAWTFGAALSACGGAESVTNDAKAPSSPTPLADCRTSGCPQLGDTCISQGCGAPWQCRGCARALVEKPVLFCGCDGQTHAETTIGCPQIEIAHDGACSP